MSVPFTASCSCFWFRNVLVPPAAHRQPLCTCPPAPGTRPSWVSPAQKGEPRPRSWACLAPGPTDARPLSLQLPTTGPSWALVTRRPGCGRWTRTSARVATCGASPCPRRTWTPSGSSRALQLTRSSSMWPAGSGTWPRSWAAPPPQARAAGSKQVSSRAASGHETLPAGRRGAAGLGGLPAPRGEVRTEPEASSPVGPDPALLWWSRWPGGGPPWPSAP